MNLKQITVALLLSAQALVCANPTYLTSQEKYDSCFSSSKADGNHVYKPFMWALQTNETTFL